ncbi:16S rRNA (cytidine(1402)-2'-O)-methyltransferase [Halarcobacter bivalviorum]|uniref:Ribosomal RNA small subunit methyltransferase I n=1 Tax=Halarcobacter bivalviorum TaxID=663364 RepID=A0AAX2A838_9BACT|nr:16S rRNA (cytidine(1402)-2'-O)-methyltransferase [Halarcobacter bivalviorum]AXH11160.1 16S rRNA (cytidine(1402)-2'-O)-methyltransferase [Halarcobacter bivalviorum]RXK09659.1 16S rRNA (cytidine(1402)-2'-O)-methyltransferase [Halarcobacter bivalviorum]
MLTLVPTPIGNLDDISKRAITALLEAELIYCEDTRVTKKLLQLLSERENLDFNCKDFKSFHSHNEKQILKNLSIEDFNKNIVYVSDAGMPCVSDPGASLVQYCIENSLDYDVIPGANAVLTAFAMSGFLNTEFTFFGFLAHKGKERREKLTKVMQSNTLSILYESPHRLLKTLEEIKDIDENRTIFLAKELTKLHQKSFKDSAINIYETFLSENIRGEWVIVIEPTQTLGENLEFADIESLDIAPKIKAKLLAKMTGKSVKEIYQQLLDKI